MNCLLFKKKRKVESCNHNCFYSPVLGDWPVCFSAILWSWSVVTDFPDTVSERAQNAINPPTLSWKWFDLYWHTQIPKFPLWQIICRTMWSNEIHFPAFTQLFRWVMGSQHLLLGGFQKQDFNCNHSHFQWIWIQTQWSWTGPFFPFPSPQLHTDCSWQLLATVRPNKHD